MSPRSSGRRAETATTTSPRRPAAAGTGASSARRAEIVRIAARLFAEKGFLGTTIRDIADEADILSGSLYHHFSSKESIADEVLSEYWTELLERYDSVMAAGLEPTEAMRELIKTSVRLLEPYEFAVRCMLNDWSYLVTCLPYLDANMSRIEGVWTRVIKEGIARGDFRDDVKAVLVYRTIMSSITGTARWFRPEGAVSTDQLAETMAELFLGGIMRPTGKDSTGKDSAGKQPRRRTATA